ncbi:stereocilin [Periophthalmus magnuspinnatus]|uniref:stereocilin n=1 Tax=Periophthalmus magnuspinnatus TaxID=409849 RepID=UPI0024369D8E|nr:stereocilin [Periophthalmus magnuspinnatus]
MATLLLFTTVVICGTVMGQESEGTGRNKDEQRNAILVEVLSKLSKTGWNSQKSPPDSTKSQNVHPIMRNIIGRLKTLFPHTKMPSLNKPIDRHRLSGFLYNISQYLQEMGAELEEAPAEPEEEQLWEKVLHFFLQSEGSAATNQWNGRVPPRPSFTVQDWFLSLRGSQHWDWLLGLLQSLITLSEKQSYKPLLTVISQNWKTVSAVLEATLQALVSGTYGQASAGLQGFICALKGQSDCTYSVSWLQQLLRFLETRNWKPVVSLHPPTETMEQNRGSGGFGRLKPFSLPPEAMRQDVLNMSTSFAHMNTTDGDSASMQSFLLQALSRSSGSGERGSPSTQKNLALVQSLDGLRSGLLHRVGSSVYSNLRRKVSRVTMAMLDDVEGLVDVPQPDTEGRCSVGDLRQLILWGIRHNLTWNTQALGFNSHSLPTTRPVLSCPSMKLNEQQLSTSSKAASLLQKRHRKHDKLFSSAHKSHLNSTQKASDQLRETDYFSTTEILEAACNESIPGLTGVSNFTVFLYCKLFEGENGSVDGVVAHMGLDLPSTCSDAAWYLAAAEEDFLWVHICSEFFASEFNNTVCANSSFWLQKVHEATATKDYNFFNFSSIDDLCVQMLDESTGNAALSEDCLALLGSTSLNAEAFRHCFLPNSSVLISALCGKAPPDSPHPLPEGSWAAAYCSKIHNSSSIDTSENMCHYRHWAVHHFLNSALLEHCAHTPGLKEYICQNTSLLQQLVRSVPQFLDLCANFQAELEGRKCFLQRFFEMLPAPYEFDSAQLCVNPAPLMMEVVHKLSMCEIEGGEREGFLVVLGYVLRLLDFIVGLSSGLEEGEREARQGLGQAILLSSLLDNASWSSVQPEASTSVLQTVGVFLLREKNATLKEDLLSCFSPVLWNLIEQDNNSTALRVLMQEYLRLPRSSIRSLVMSAEKDAVKRFISHMHQSWDQLQVHTSKVSQKELQAMETMTAAFLHKFPRVTPELFIDLSQFIPFMSVSDIMNFPTSLVVNDSVLTAIRDHSSGMRSLQKKAFVNRILQSSVVGDVQTWPPYFLASILPFLPYLPVTHFQQLTSQQLTPLAELLGNSSLDGVRGRHVLRTLFTKKKNLTGDNITRLGILACYLDPFELHSFFQDPAVASALWQQLAECMSKGLISTKGRLSSWLVPAVQSLNVSSMALQDLFALSGVLPELGASFLLSLPSEELIDVLSQPVIPQYSPAQAFQILSKISNETILTMDKLCRLKALHSGLSPAVLQDLQWDNISQSVPCQCWSSLFSELKPGQRAMLYYAVQEALQSELWSFIEQAPCLLPFVPLKKLILDLNNNILLNNISLLKEIPWSSQQAQFLMKKILQLQNTTSSIVRDLGLITGGVSCNLLKSWINGTEVDILDFLTDLPGDIRPALRKCIVDELRRRPDVDLNVLSSGFALTLPVTMVEKLSNESFRNLLGYIQRHFSDFLKLPHYKQIHIAERAVTELDDVGEIDSSALEFLGPLLPFLDGDSLELVDRGALALRLEEMRNFCLPKEALKDISALLTQKDLLGEPSKWHVKDLEHLGRLVFSLSPKQINSIPLTVLTKDTVEQVLVGQKLWEDSAIGRMCVEQCVDQESQRKRTESLLRGITKPRNRRAKVPVPSCADIKGTFPSAWTPLQLNRMSQENLKQCVEVFGQDSSLSYEQRCTLWKKLRKSFSPVRKLREDQVLSLGFIVTEMGERELQDTDLSDPGVLAHLGTLTEWSNKKMRAVIISVLRKRKQKIEQLTAVDLATFGHLICGLYPSEIKRLSPYNLSMAVLFLREMSLPCTEHQMEALTGCLSRPEAFGPVSTWGSEVFTEIGTLAAGLEDIVLSALVEEQVQGITAEAIRLMSPQKFSVVFSVVQLSWLSTEQAWAVTEEQWAELDPEQKHALGLTRYEGDILLEQRGRNSATSAVNMSSLAICSLALCLLLWQLI